MKMTNKILTAILICMPMVAWGQDYSNISFDTLDRYELDLYADRLFNELKKDPDYSLDDETKDNIIAEARTNLNNQDGSPAEESPDANSSETDEDAKQNETDTKQSLLDAAKDKVTDAQDKLDKAKENEQSLGNRMLGGLTTLATGIGGMQLAQGLAEKSADSAADKDMAGYIETMRCTYGEGKSVPFGTEPVELPGGNNSELTNYRNEYLALADELKSLKSGLDLKPGIEAEEILDKATSGLYDDENKGITGGTYASRYRAAAGNEKDEKGLKSDKKEAKTRMIAGGVVAGVGLVGGMVANSIMNGKLGELIKERKDAKSNSKENDAAITKLKDKMEDYGIRRTDRLDLSKLDVRGLGDKIGYVRFKDEVKGEYATDLFKTDTTSDFITSFEKHLTDDSKKDLEKY